jgi:hypothetical protein
MRIRTVPLTLAGIAGDADEPMNTVDFVYSNRAEELESDSIRVHQKLMSGIYV